MIDLTLTFWNVFFILYKHLAQLVIILVIPQFIQVIDDKRNVLSNNNLRIFHVEILWILVILSQVLNFMIYEFWFWLFGILVKKCHIKNHISSSFDTLNSHILAIVLIVQLFFTVYYVNYWIAVLSNANDEFQCIFQCIFLPYNEFISVRDRSMNIDSFSCFFFQEIGKFIILLSRPLPT